ncbi:MAG: hypothetical protein A2504_02695 [Bdellovibrionales bacterium RIFOXYD12_FULL_39_22]|nr:MAG: hypothetical protein A2385_12725 [Bdellovibrionales bacterium RIFOXYB1_FULL_39_21]OFZ41213.1 MAG: hypothetical protein A2485_01135 [Bdellovibrionales bacterium RIFOXYC12_FULL_39_17]OFZ44967.1 MAG: hypothetical protein A2404_11880 [Bdellovibrionales bacterium RIFOXYC1_FULL_39_130]OFZ74414.1 MAG: hypothetical protein A2560_12250 [Bdellovibrionales bacterium RIFOXYD1_FULL_39_84]OFZ92416.1 MAG: hypothetical protein A2504_02695 [Bdellovibrionales bacterium RIFOXYD12_FULL_39_22]HLE10745.1 AT
MIRQFTTIPRLLTPLKTRSFFLFGVRGSGKSTFINSQFHPKNSISINLLRPEIENRYALNPESLEQEIDILKRKPDWVFIDEIQKVPKLLDVVHDLIERKNIRFILTGSSARKLKQGAANLLAGRANVYWIHPLSYLELSPPSKTTSLFSLLEYLRWGGLPSIQSMSSEREKIAFLNSYVLTYLSEEIKAEQILRKLDPFRSFLQILGQVSGKIINHQKIANEVGVDSKTVQNYFQILEDTLLGFYLPVFHQSVRKSQRLSPKFYVIDTGIKKALEGSLDQKPAPRTSEYGELFEHFVISEIKKLNDYFEKNFRFSFFSTKNQVEIDLILTKANSNILIEIKSTEKIDRQEIKSLAKIATDFPGVRGVYYLSRDPISYKIDGVQCLPWDLFLKKFKQISRER